MKQQFLSKRTFIFFAVPILLICIAGLFPLFQHIIVDATSDFMKRRLDADWWMPRIKIYSTMVISAILAIYFFAYTKYGCEIFSGIKREFAELFGSLKKRENRRFFVFIFSVFIVGIFTIIRANYSYIDDMGRATQGYNHLDTWSRFLAGALAMLIHASPRLMDISPLPQISACLILAFGAFVFAYIATEKKVTWLSCIAALPIGLSAYFLENLTFKFDAPYMALAVVFGIVPFLFVNNKKAFSAASILGLLGTCFTYQSASGVYIVLTIFFAFLFYCEKSWDIKKTFSFIGHAAVAYIAGLLIFRVLFMTEDISYASTGMFSMSRIIPGCLSNIRKYLSFLYSDLGGSVFSVMLITVLIFCSLKVLLSESKKIFLFILMIISFFLMTCLSFGAYLALENPLWNPRAFAGTGILFAAFCMFCVCGNVKSKLRKCSGAAVTVLCYTMLVFALCYGNTIAEQKRFNFLRTTLLASDLAEVCSQTEEVKLHINNNFEQAPTVSAAAEILPLANRLCSGIFADDRWGYHYLSQYFHFNFLKVKESVDDSDFAVLKENTYHIIKGRNGFVTVTFKQIIPQEKDCLQ